MTINRELFYGLLAGAIGVAVLLHVCGCSPAFDAQGYAQEQAACVATAKDRPSADACRAAVRARFGLPARDGGAQ